MINAFKPKQLLFGLLMFCHCAFGKNDYEQIREHIRALKSQEYLIGVVVIDMQMTGGHIQGNPPPTEPVSNIVQFVFEQDGPVAQLFYYDQTAAPLDSVSSIKNLIPEHISNSSRYSIGARWLTCPTNTMIRSIRFMQNHGVTHLLVIGSNHNNAIQYMLQEASFNGIQTLTFSPLIGETTQLQDLTHAELTRLFNDNKFYTGVKINCVPDRGDDLENRTRTKPNVYNYQSAPKQTSLFEWFFCKKKARSIYASGFRKWLG